MKTLIDSQVIERFFSALDALIERNELDSIQSYCTAEGMDSRHVYSLRTKHSAHLLHFDCLVPLIMNYGISALWLTTGVGDMFMPMYRTEKIRS